MINVNDLKLSKSLGLMVIPGLLPTRLRETFSVIKIWEPDRHHLEATTAPRVWSDLGPMLSLNLSMDEMS